MSFQSSRPGDIILKLPVIPVKGKTTAITIAAGEGQVASATGPGGTGGLGDEVVKNAVGSGSGSTMRAEREAN